MSAEASPAAAGSAAAAAQQLAGMTEGADALLASLDSDSPSEFLSCLDYGIPLAAGVVSYQACPMGSEGQSPAVTRELLAQVAEMRLTDDEGRLLASEAEMAEATMKEAEEKTPPCITSFMAGIEKGRRVLAQMFEPSSVTLQRLLRG